MNALRLLIVCSIAAFSIASIRGEPFDAPNPDRCSDPRAGSVDTLEIGGANATTFEVLDDDAVIELVFGGQGASMFAVRFRLRGSDVPSCVAQTSALHDCPEGQLGCSNEEWTIAESVTPLRTYEEPDGSRSTDVHYVIISGRDPRYGDSFELRTTVAGISRTIRLWNGAQYAPDASPQDAAPAPDAQPLPDAQGSDAAPNDAGSPDA